MLSSTIYPRSRVYGPAQHFISFINFMHNLSNKAKSQIHVSTDDSFWGSFCHFGRERVNQYESTSMLCLGCVHYCHQPVSRILPENKTNKLSSAALLGLDVYLHRRSLSRYLGGIHEVTIVYGVYTNVPLYRVLATLMAFIEVWSIATKRFHFNNSAAIIKLRQG